MDRVRNTVARLLVLVLCTFAPGQNSPDTSHPSELQKGQIVTIHSSAKPEQSYALYVPSNYGPERRWPIVYAFDPSANGARPVKRMKDAAESYGYIVAGSNNSRNGAWEIERDAAQEMWNDTHRRLSLDERRAYFAGFSGGARLSAQLALGCNCVRGVFLSGAGFPLGNPPSRKSVFPVFATAGMTDFNYGELVELDAQLEALGFRHFLQRFDGTHEWAPAKVWQQALAWSALLEMKDSLRPLDKTLVNAELEQASERLEKREQVGEIYFAAGETRSLIAEFDGLTDTSALKARLASLEKNPAVQASAKQERAGIDKQRALETDIVRTIQSLQNAGEARDSQLMDASNHIRQLREELRKERRPESQLVLKRALGSIFVVAMEAGSPILEKGDARAAAHYFELAATAMPEWDWAYMSLASCHAITKDKKSALRDLKQARQAGVSPAQIREFVKADPKLAALVDGPEYQKLVAEPSP